MHLYLSDDKKKSKLKISEFHSIFLKNKTIFFSTCNWSMGHSRETIVDVAASQSLKVELRGSRTSSPFGP